MWFSRKPAAKVNMDLVEDVLDQIRAQPKLWAQSDWSRVEECGTKHCFGGWACTLEGRTKEVENHGYPVVLATDRSGNTKHYAAVAAELLGFNDVLAGRVFYNMENDVAMFERDVRSDIAKFGNMTRKQLKAYRKHQSR